MVGAIGFHAARQDHRVLDRHGCALGQERQHGMAGVAEQGGAPHAPAVHGLTAEQGPFVRTSGRLDQGVDVRMPAGVVGQAFLHRALDRPGLHPPVAALDHRDIVHQFAPPQRIVDHVASGPDPGGRQGRHQPRLEAFGRDHAAPGDHAGEPRPVRPEQAGPHRRMHPVRTDHQVRPRLSPAPEAQHRPALVLVHANASGAEQDGVRPEGPHRLGEDPMQVVAMQGDVGKAIETGGGVADVEGLPGLAGVP